MNRNGSSRPQRDSGRRSRAESDTCRRCRAAPPQFAPHQPVAQHEHRGHHPADQRLRPAHRGDEQRNRDERPDADHVGHVERRGLHQAKFAGERFRVGHDGPRRERGTKRNDKALRIRGNCGEKPAMLSACPETRGSVGRPATALGSAIRPTLVLQLLVACRAVAAVDRRFLVAVLGTLIGIGIAAIR